MLEEKIKKDLSRLVLLLVITIYHAGREIYKYYSEQVYDFSIVNFILVTIVVYIFMVYTSNRIALWTTLRKSGATIIATLLYISLSIIHIYIQSAS
ncbi:hypothetical protein PV797_14760 [Clostridiaceae bacterium M8S5]|nr:hypothetical protein PV797_14760 [Clostridiaceae bacterium M8S5]